MVHVAGNDPVSIYFRTFNESEPSNGKAILRAEDGLFESGHSRPANDPFFSVSPCFDLCAFYLSYSPIISLIARNTCT